MQTKHMVRPTGHLQVKGSRGERAYYALWRDVTGRHHRKLGPAWVKDSGRRTPRNAVIWIARDGTKPDGYLTPADARDRLQAILAAAPRQPSESVLGSERLTLRQACDNWLNWAERDSEVKPSTLGDYRNVTDRICRDLGATTPIAGITPAVITRWISALQAERRLSPETARTRQQAGAGLKRLADGTIVQLTSATSRTKRKYLANLNGVMKRAVKSGMLESNPVEPVDRPGRARSRHSLSTSHFLQPHEVHALVRAAGQISEQDAAIFLLAAFCGLRLGELLDLRWQAIDFERSLVHVESSYVRNVAGTPKSNVGRVVPMAPEVATALARHSQRESVRSNSDLVFSGRGRRHVDGNALRLRFYDALARADLKRIRIHDLRHTFGTVCAASSIPQTTIKEWMGHSDLATTEIYTAYYPRATDAERISAAFADASGVPVNA